MKNKNDIEVLIDGRKYTLAGFESNEYLQKVASYLNEKFAELKKLESYRHMDMEFRNVLLAINIADDYFRASKKANEYHSERELKDKMVLEMKHKIIDMQEAEKKKNAQMLKLTQELEELKKKNIELETRLKQIRR